MAEFEFMDEGQSGASDLLQKIFLFHNLDFAETNALLEICHSEHRTKGDLIIAENSVGQALYLIKDGTARVYKGAEDKGEKLAILGQGELFGEMSLIEDSLTSANVIAESDLSLVAIHRGDFEQLLAQNEKIALKVYKSFCRVLSERLRRTTGDLHSQGIPAKGVF
jgi:CRP/FNR family transcriptional regulator, cyclic AMP receptor protein